MIVMSKRRIDRKIASSSASFLSTPPPPPPPPVCSGKSGYIHELVQHTEL